MLENLMPLRPDRCHDQRERRGVIRSERPTNRALRISSSGKWS